MVSINASASKDIDDTELLFGKHKGKTPNQIAKTDPQYLLWLYENVDPKVLSKDLYMAVEMDDHDHTDDIWSIY